MHINNIFKESELTRDSVCAKFAHTADELLRELAFKRMVDKGLADAKQGNVVSNEEMHSRILSCFSQVVVMESHVDLAG